MFCKIDMSFFTEVYPPNLSPYNNLLVQCTAHFFISEEIFEEMWGKSEKMQSGHKIRKIIYSHFKLS